MATAEIHRRIGDRVHHQNQREVELVQILEPIEGTNHGAYEVNDQMYHMKNQHLRRIKIKRRLPAREPVSRRCLVAQRRQHQTRNRAGKQEIVEFLGISRILI